MVSTPIKSTTSLTIDREQAKRQLTLLGYKSGDNVYMRFFVPEGDPRYGTKDAARKANKLNWAEVARYQADGYGVYFVVNGGGHRDKDVSECRALFWEWDDRPIEDQVSAWQELDLPEPSMQVRTRKSVHNYLRADLTKEQWLELQQDLLAYTQSDQKLKNPSRVLRLAGCWHIKPGHDPIRCDIIHESERVYTYEELRAAIPRQQKQQQTVINYQPSISDDVPLYQFLTKDDRALIDQGAPQGSRNGSGAKLARNLIGTAARLNHLGIRYSDDPRNLFHDYCHRCNPSISYSEGETIWKSALKDNPTPSLSDDALENCAKAWLRNQEKSSSGRGYSSNRRSFGGGSGGNSGDGGDGGNESKILQFPGGDGSPLAFVKQVLSETKSKSERDSAFVSSRYNPRDLQAIARELEREEDITEEQQEAKEALPRLLQKPSLDPRDYLWGDGGQLAQAIVDTANAMPANPSKLFTTLIPVAATPIGASSRIVVKPSAKYVQPCIFWTGNVDPTGSNKSGIQSAITSPLIRLEIEANQQYQTKLEDYDIEIARWQKQKGDPEDKPKKPTRKRYLTKDSTIATLERIHGENPRGILVNSEELVADFKRENAHTGGRGADRESKLDQWNGSCFLTDRAERTVVLERTAVSRTGTIQLETLQNLFRDASIFDSGMIPRWLFDAASSPPRFIEFDDAPDTGIDDLLTQLYKRLEKMPQADYLLSAEAKPVFRDWQHSLVRRTIAEDGAIKQILPKIEAYTARFALWLHVVNSALAEVTPPPTISALTMSRAVALAQYYLRQWEFILAINSPDLSLTGILLKMYEHIKSKPNGIKISLLKSGIRALRSTDKKEVHNHCLWLVDNGYAVITDNIITALQKDQENRVYDIYDNFMTPCHKVQPTTKQGLDKFYDAYDTKTEVAEGLPGTNEVHYKVESSPPENVICHKSDVLMVETTVVQSVDTHDTGVINAVITHDACHEQPEVTGETSQIEATATSDEQVTTETEGDELIDAVTEIPATEPGISSELLASLIHDAQDWEEVQLIVSTAPEQKKQVWALLSSEDKERIREMKEAIASPAPIENRPEQPEAVAVEEKTETREELLGSGQGVGLIVRVRDIWGKPSAELFEIQSWDDRNQLYRLSNDELAYPYDLILVE